MSAEPLPHCRACGFPMSARNVLDDQSPRYCPNLSCPSFNQGPRMASRLQRGEIPGATADDVKWLRFTLTNFLLGFVLWLVFVAVLGAVIGFWTAVISAVVFGAVTSIFSILEHRINRGKW